MWLEQNVVFTAAAPLELLSVDKHIGGLRDPIYLHRKVVHNRKGYDPSGDLER